MLAVLKEVEHLPKGIKTTRVEIVLSESYIFHHDMWDKQALIIDLYEHRTNIHNSNLADDKRAAKSKAKCHRDCTGEPGVCSRSLGSMAILDCEN